MNEHARTNAVPQMPRSENPTRVHPDADDVRSSAAMNDLPPDVNRAEPEGPFPAGCVAVRAADGTTERAEGRRPLDHTQTAAAREYLGHGLDVHPVPQTGDHKTPVTWWAKRPAIAEDFEDT